MKETFKLISTNPWKQISKDADKLTRLAYQYKTNKVPPLGHSYTGIYHNMFLGKTNDVRKVLQIGLGKTEENSLYMWRDFFPKAKIYGISSDKKYVFKANRIQTYLGERTDTKGLRNIIDNIGSDIDMVIDEGAHNPKEIVASIQTLMPILKRDVIYVIENIDRPQTAAITAGLTNYNYYISRYHKMISRFDRLIVVTNKIG